MSKSLRSRLTIATAATTAAVLLLLSLSVFFATRSMLWSEFDEALEAEAHGLAAFVEQIGDRVEMEIDDRIPSVFQSDASGAYFEVYLRGGPAFAASPSLGDGHLERIESRGIGSVARHILLPSGHDGRAVGLSFRPHVETDPPDPDDEEDRARGALPSVELNSENEASAHPIVTIVVAQHAERVEAAVAKTGLILAVSSAIAIGATLLVLNWVIARGLAPLRTLADRIETIDETDLSPDLPADDAPRELRPVIRRLNALFERLDRAFERERAFSADVAHELRTPVAGILSTLEVGISRERSSAEYRECMRDSLGVARTMRTTVDNLLTIGRIESGRQDVRLASVAMGDAVAESWRPYARIADDRGITVTRDIAATKRARTNEDLLKQVLRIVFENAVEHGDAGGDVVILVRDSAAGVQARVANSGSRVRPDDADRVFDRFWRGDASREHTERHAGLGLSLCRQLCDLLEISITVTTDVGGEFVVTLDIPAAATPSPISRRALVSGPA